MSSLGVRSGLKSGLGLGAEDGECVRARRFYAPLVLPIVAGLLALVASVPAAWAGLALKPPLIVEWEAIKLLDGKVHPGQFASRMVVVSESLAGADVPTPVFIHRGSAPGPTLCLTAGIHGDEVNGVEVVRRVIDLTDAATLNGTLISVPIVNLSAVRRASRYLPDRRDLNRYFPGRRLGSAASRIAHNFFESVIRHCEFLIDIHTGSFHRSNLHQLRADLRDPRVAELARGLGSSVVVHKEGGKGTLRGAALSAGIPAVTIEGGEPARLSIPEVEKGVASIRRLMRELHMVPASDADAAPGEAPAQHFYTRSHWVRAPAGGILVARAKLGQRISAGEELGTIRDPLSSRTSTLESSYDGHVIGIAFDQLVMPGFAAIHVGVVDDSPVDRTGLSFEPPTSAPDDFDDPDLEERPE